jgi:hypothetical protein
LLQQNVLPEMLVAELAWIGLFSGVSSSVRSELIALGKLTATVGALK